MTSGCWFQLWCCRVHFFQELLLQTALAGRNRKRDTIAQLDAGGQNCHSGQTGASPILLWSELSFGRESLKAPSTVLPLLRDCALREALAVPLGVPLLSGRGSPCCDTGCVAISHRDEHTSSVDAEACL